MCTHHASVHVTAVAMRTTQNLVLPKVYKATNFAVIIVVFFISSNDNCKKKRACLLFRSSKFPAGEIMCIACVALIAASMFFIVAVVFNPLKG